MKIVRTSIALLVLALASVAQTTGIVIATKDELTADIASVSCGDRRKRLEAVKKLFVEKGAADGEIETVKSDGTENVIIRKKGTGTGTVIVGAHYDKADIGCGAIDNWSGIVIVANLYRSIRPLRTEKSYIFVAFDREEDGLKGSDAMADGIKKDERDSYCAMVNFDSFGLGYPNAFKETSDKLLMDLAETVSAEMKIPFSRVSFFGAGADSESFKAIKIPSITLDGLNGRFAEYIHTPNDIVKNVDLVSVELGYRHGLVMLSKIDRKPCDAFRKSDSETRAK